MVEMILDPANTSAPYFNTLGECVSLMRLIPFFRSNKYQAM